MDYIKEISELREKLNCDTSDPDFTKSDLYHREIRHELLLKRDQVIQLKKELQVVNMKLFDKNRELENTKSLLKEKEFNLKLVLKKSESSEEKLKEIDEAYTNLKLKEEMKLCEIQILNENIQKLAQENHQLSREVEEFKDKLKYSRAFQEELEERQTRITAIMTKTKEHTEKLEKEHLNVREIDKIMLSTEEFKSISQVLKKENEKLQKENIRLENSLTESVAKYEKLSNILKEQNMDPHQQNAVRQVKFLQWEMQHKTLQEKNLHNEELIGTLTAALNKEIETNALLILQTEDYEARIKEFEKLHKINSIKEENISVVEVD